MLMILSLVCGIMALVLPLRGIIKKGQGMNGEMSAIVSMAACGIAVLSQLVYVKSMVELEDWTALMDTIGMAVLISGGLLLGTIILNIIAVKYKRG